MIYSSGDAYVATQNYLWRVSTQGDLNNPIILASIAKNILYRWCRVRYEKNDLGKSELQQILVTEYDLSGPVEESTSGESIMDWKIRTPNFQFMDMIV